MKFWKSITEWFLESLEKRLIGALGLIVVLTLVLQVVSQNEAWSLHRESDALIKASAIAENADQFAEAVREFQAASNRGLVATDSSRTNDMLTDAAIATDNYLAKLRSSGTLLYGLPQTSAVFANLDEHVRAILQVQASDASEKGLVARIQARNAAMAHLANEILQKAHATRDAAQTHLIASIERWRLLVLCTGMITIMVVLIVMADLIRNILPAIRRMHESLRNLAGGDLDLEIGAFRLKELQALSGPLETFRKNARAVRNLAFTDAATGLPNRRAFQEECRVRLGKRAQGRMACMLVDIDRFKHVNDDYGHAAGDELVGLIGNRMIALLGDDSFVSRVGGDEFAILVRLNASETAHSLANTIVEKMRAPFSLGEYSIVVTVSIGVVQPENANEPNSDALLRCADMALYASKKNGRNCATAFSSLMAQERALDRALERDLETAFDDDQLRMVYQPIHSVIDDTQEVEALVRWRHPELGDVPPSTFIPAAERSGLMVRLGEWIIQRALRDFSAWPDMHMSINLSPLQLQHDGFGAFLLDCCRQNGIAPQRLFLEVTESLSIERNTRALLTLTLLRNMGFRIALDDFGTGYSSLSMVKSFKFDRMKLDRSLVMDLGQDPASMAVLEAAVTMARHVGAQVVAEGISEAHLIGATKSAGCTHLQGYHFSRPIEAGAVRGYFDSLSSIEEQAPGQERAA